MNCIITLLLTFASVNRWRFRGIGVCCSQLLENRFWKKYLHFLTATMHSQCNDIWQIEVDKLDMLRGGSGFRTLDSLIRSMIRIATKIVSLGPWAMPYPSKKFCQNPFTSLRVIRRTYRQTDRHTDRQTDRQTDRNTDRQTDRTKNITSFFGRSNDKRVNCRH